MLTTANTTSFMNFDSELIRLPPYVVISVLLICEGEVSPHLFNLSGLTAGDFKDPSRRHLCSFAG